MMLEDEQRGRDDAREAASKAERRVGEINSELDALRGQLEQVRALWLSWNLKLILIFSVWERAPLVISKFFVWTSEIFGICRVIIGSRNGRLNIFGPNDLHSYFWRFYHSVIQHELPTILSYIVYCIIYAIKATKISHIDGY